MIVGPLKNNSSVAIILLLIISFVLWIQTFFFLNSSIFSHDASKHLLYHTVYYFGYSFISKQILSLGIILLGALLLNFLSIEFEVVEKKNYLPALFYILFSFASLNKSTIDPQLVANVFLLLSFYYIITSYRKDKALPETYKAGLFIGIASFFCTQYILFFPIVFTALLILRAFNWREWLVLLIGIFTPLYIFLSFNYLSSNTSNQIIVLFKSTFSVAQFPIISEYYILFITVTVALFVASIIFNARTKFGNKVKTQKIYFILLWMLPFSMLIMFFTQTSDMILLPFIIPFSIFIGNYLGELKQLKISNTLLVLFLGAISIIMLHALGKI